MSSVLKARNIVRDGRLGGETTPTIARASGLLHAERISLQGAAVKAQQDLLTQADIML